jgi:hypothetical protein
MNDPAERSTRSRERREAIYRSYEAAAADPLFMAEHEQLTRQLDRTTGDGLHPASSPSR